MSSKELLKEIRSLKKKLAESQTRLQERKERVIELKAANKALQERVDELEVSDTSDESDGSESNGEEEEEGGDQLEEDESSSEEEDEKPYWDEEVWKCSRCSGEVDEDHCIVCDKAFTTPERKNVYSCSTISQAYSYDRRFVRRGSTPLLDIGSKSIRVPNAWSAADRDKEYRSLIRRGCTPLMCEKYCLTYSKDKGIWAFADQDLLDEFSGDGMEGCFWKIYLGRRVELDVEDHHGSEFIVGLVEDAVLFCKGPERWETVQKGNFWYTRPREEWMDPKGGDEEEDDDGQSGDEEEGDEEEGDGDEDEKQDITDLKARDGDGGGYDSDLSEHKVIFKTWVSDNRYEDPTTGAVLIENRYYDTDEDDFDELESDPAQGMDTEGPEDLQANGEEVDDHRSSAGSSSNAMDMDEDSDEASASDDNESDRDEGMGE